VICDAHDVHCQSKNKWDDVHCIKVKRCIDCFYGFFRFSKLQSHISLLFATKKATIQYKSHQLNWDNTWAGMHLWAELDLKSLNGQTDVYKNYNKSESMFIDGGFIFLILEPFKGIKQKPLNQIRSD